ncbi:MAG: RdgB/HAM1 family non-canonical purine NTP pyrophosphatase [Steroidobacteraceae bacterium]
MRVVLATHNAHKCAELQELLAGSGIELVPLSAFTGESAAETGLTFIENALLKARFAAQAAGLPALADDSGLSADALKGAPGIYSARYAGIGASDQDNLERLLDALSQTPESLRTARYHCALAYLRFESDPAPIVCHATWEGRILRAPKGTGGFGYDPIFEVDGLGCSAAELSRVDKNRLSHRGLALAQLLQALRNEPRVMA